jgi:hypothetical protein
MFSRALAGWIAVPTQLIARDRDRRDADTEELDDIDQVPRAKQGAKHLRLAGVTATGGPDGRQSFR